LGDLPDQCERRPPTQPRKNLWEYYAVLGLRPGASSVDVKQAYRRLVKQWHPDRFAHDARSQRIAEEKLKEINEAYSAVSGAHSTTTYKSSNTYQQRPSSQWSTGRNTQSGYARPRGATSSRPRPRTRPAATAYESASYSYREVSRPERRWVGILAWCLVILMINVFSSPPTAPVQIRTATWSEPKTPYIPLQPVQTNSDWEYSRELQQQLEQTAKSLRTKSGAYQPNYIRLRLKELQATQKSTIPEPTPPQPAAEPPSLLPVKNFPVPSTTWPGFSPSTETSAPQTVTPDRSSPPQPETKVPDPPQ